jgi:hypothetical protein
MYVVMRSARVPGPATLRVLDTQPPDSCQACGASTQLITLCFPGPKTHPPFSSITATSAPAPTLSR